MPEVRLDPALTGIALAAVEAALRPDRWGEVCDMVADRYGANNFVLMSYDPVAAKGSSIHTSRSLRSVFGILSPGFYEGSEREDNAIYEALLSARPNVFRTEAQILGLKSAADIRSNRFRDEILRLTGAVSRNGARLNDVGPFVDCAALHLPYADDIPTRTTDEMNAVLPVFGKALEAGRILRALTRGYGALLEVFDRLHFGAAICEADGRIVLSNARFREMAADGDALANAPGVLAARDPGDAGRLGAAIRDALRPGAGAGGLIATLARRSGRRPYVVKTVPLHDREVRPAPLTLAVILDPEDTAQVNAAGIAAFGLLTPAELAVCELLVQGLPAAEIAERRDTSVETARGQAKAVAQKLDCRTRLDLVRLAMATTAPLRDR